MTHPPPLVCLPDRTHWTTTARLSVVLNRRTDLERWQAMASGPHAQRWLGWSDEEIRDSRLPRPVSHRMLPLRLGYLFFAAFDRAHGRLVGGAMIARNPDGAPEIGGAMDPLYRGQGYGTELLRTACVIAHRHFGIPRIRAGCEVTNAVSRAWLASAGFVPDTGPATRTLPNGRVVEALWFTRTDDGAVLACEHITRPIRARLRGFAAPGRWRRRTATSERV